MSVIMRDLLFMVNFYHPCLSGGATLLYQSILLPISRPAGSSGVPFHAYLLCAFAALGSLSCTMAAYIGLPGSIISIMKDSQVIMIVLLRMLILGKWLSPHQALGILIVLLGLAAIAYVSLTGMGWSSSENNVQKGLLFAIAASFFGAVQKVLEEKFMKQYAIPPELLAGMEGVLGFVACVAALVVANLFHLTNSWAAFETMCSNKVTLFVFIGLLVITPPYKFAARTVTCYSSATLRQLLATASVFLIWAVELSCGWVRCSWLALVGFLVIASGMMVYLGVWRVPRLYHEDAEEERQALLPSKEQP